MLKNTLKKTGLILTIMSVFTFSIQSTVSAATTKSNIVATENGNSEVVEGTEENWQKLKFEDNSTLEKVMKDGKEILVAKSANGKSYEITTSEGNVLVNGEKVNKENVTNLSKQNATLSMQSTTDNTWLHSTTRNGSINVDYAVISLIAGVIAVPLTGLAAGSAIVTSIASGLYSIEADNVWYEKSIYVTCFCPSALTKRTTVFYLDSSHNEYYETVFH
ncbi:hypothetical protein SAMN05192559_1018 [Halobacillus karajensis]|uniref:Uncharacterized protein n=1 Tax=Halobacillus karajensis TaxID=195088 RepID=A0A024P387_9BACI|nr:hypothetical protein [Halobacillus karajensis]CDQ19339.1 hypothetical protein BN982_01628 [Halobacillus karajensis]CDQ22498.1 hypothetical protein BN983_00709 [Halobacillus karajensis]CDQ25980.1 hypothetical protein BN981_00189 [Halobacillus karajensis]SEH38143.1 hypothetical protein SAMN05192559_1018 [Halobacillus karajensis]